MTDLSQVSTADLMKAAGIQAPNDLSQVPTADLMQAAGIKTPASSLGYVGSRLLGGFLEGGKQLASAASTEMGQNEQGQELQNLPSGQETANKAIYGTPTVEAPNVAARYAGNVASGFGANPVMSAIAPGFAVAGGLGSEGGSDLNKAVGSPIPDVAARFLGGVAGGGVYGAGKAGIKALASGSESTLPEDLAGNKDVSRAMSQKERFGETLIGQYQQPAQQAAEAIGPSISPTQIGKNILDKVQGWLGLQKASASRDFSAIEAQFPEGSRVDLPATTGLLTKPGEGPPLPAVANQLGEQIGKSGGTLPYQALKQWRTEVGGALANEPRLKPLYDALTEDMKGGLQARGGDQAVAAFEQANSGYRNAQSFIEDRLGKLTDASVPPERLSGIINNPGKNATQLGDLVNAGVIDKGDIASIARAWMEKAGKDAEGLWNPVSFSKAFGKLQMQSPEAVRLLFGDNPAIGDLTQRAAALSSTVSPLARANMPTPGLLRKAVPAAVGIAAQEAGIPGGELAAGWILGHGNGPNPNPLYALPRQSMLMPIANPLLAGGAMSLLNPSGRNAP